MLRSHYKQRSKFQPNLAPSLYSDELVSSGAINMLVISAGCINPHTEQREPGEELHHC